MTTGELSYLDNSIQVVTNDTGMPFGMQSHLHSFDCFIPFINKD